MKRIAMLVSLAFLLGQLACGQTFFANPVICGDVADPTIIRWSDVYYAAGTSSEWAPHYPLFRSTDLVNKGSQLTSAYSLDGRQRMDIPFGTNGWNQRNVVGPHLISWFLH